MMPIQVVVKAKIVESGHREITIPVSPPQQPEPRDSWEQRVTPVLQPNSSSLAPGLSLNL
jgi:hypothetical protein